MLISTSSNQWLFDILKCLHLFEILWQKLLAEIVTIFSLHFWKIIETGNSF